MRPKKVILCVDDNEEQLSILSFLLRTHGYAVLAATRGPEAIELFTASPEVNLVLADHAMPGMAGDELVLKLKAIASHVPMVILGDPSKMNRDSYRADAFLSKDTISSLELLERIRIMSARKRCPRYGFRKPVQSALPEVASTRRTA